VGVRAMSDRSFDVFANMVGRLRRVGAAYVADTAVIVGDVELGVDSSVWFGAILRGDDAAIEIGPTTNIQDGSVVHADVDTPQRIGSGVTVGHGAILHGAEVGDHALIGMGARLLAGSRIGPECIIGAGAVVAENAVIPPRSVVLGVPGRVRRTVTDAEIEQLRQSALHYVGRARSYLSPQDAS